MGDERNKPGPESAPDRDHLRGDPPPCAADLDLSLFNRKYEHGCLHIECRSCAERTDDPVLERVREIFGDR